MPPQDSVASTSIETLAQQLKEVEPGQMVALYVEAVSLPECARFLVQLSAERVASKQSPCPLDLVIYQRPEAGCLALDLACLEPLAKTPQGVYLAVLEMEISVRKGVPDGLARLLTGGHALSRLSLAFVEHLGNRSAIVEAGLMQCLSRRKHPLEALELTDFHQVLHSEVLGQLLKTSLKIDSLSLTLSERRHCLDEDFRIAELMVKGLSRLHLKGMCLNANNLKGVGRGLGESRCLKSLSLQNCALTGASEELFCGLVNNRSLHTLSFRQTLVEAPTLTPAKLTPARLLRLLVYPEQLRSLHCDSFDDAEFHGAFEDLRLQRPQLDIQLHPWFAANVAPMSLRSGWHPLPGEYAAWLEEPVIVGTPVYREDEDSTQSPEASAD